MSDAILDRLELLEHYVRLLEGLRGRDLSDPYLRGSLERYLHLAAEACLDVGEMLISRERLPKPRTYRDVVRSLAEAGILPSAFAREFEGIAGLRNILVHDYARIDLQSLQANLARLDDFRVFARHVVERLHKGGRSS